jgi:hypothetical protein
MVEFVSEYVKNTSCMSLIEATFHIKTNERNKLQNFSCAGNYDYVIMLFQLIL